MDPSNGSQDKSGLEDGEEGFVLNNDDDDIEMDEGGFVKGSVRRKRGAQLTSPKPAESGGGGFLHEDDDGGGFVPDDDDSESGGGFLPNDEPADALIESDADDNSEDEYGGDQHVGASSDDAGSSRSPSGDEYNDVVIHSGRKITRGRQEVAGVSPAAKSSKSKGKGRKEKSTGNSPPREITPQQKTDARDTFGLFFPAGADGHQNLDKQRIKIKDIARVAAHLNMKLKTEEVRSHLSKSG